MDGNNEPSLLGNISVQSSCFENLLRPVQHFFRMVVDENESGERWADVERLLNRNGPMAHPDFEPGPDVRACYDFRLFLVFKIGDNSMLS